MQNLETDLDPLRRELERLSRQWIAQGLPSRETVLSAARSLAALKQQSALPGLWPTPPRMLTATLDDGIGQGLEIIHRFAVIMGLELIALGLLQKPDAIVAACLRERPRYLGLTVLQTESQDALCCIGRQLPPGTRLLAGGAAFRYDRDLAARCGVHAVATHVGHFIDFLLRDEFGGARAVPQ